MTEKNFHALMVTIVVLALITAVTTILLFYEGNVEQLIISLVTLATVLWNKIDMKKMTADNQKSNEVVQMQVQKVSDKADSIIEKADSVVDAAKRM